MFCMERTHSHRIRSFTTSNVINSIKKYLWQEIKKQNQNPNLLKTEKTQKNNGEEKGREKNMPTAKTKER